MGLYTNGNKISPVVLKTQSIEKEVVKENDVTFYDYDGSILYSYTTSDFLKLEQLPPNPPAKTNIEVPLTPQGWNWDYSDAIDYVQTNGKLDIGQSYVPTDEATHIIIEIDNEDALPLQYSVRFKASVNKGVEINWGDGDVTTSSGTSASSYSHTYNTIGIYNIKLDVLSGTIDFTGSSSGNIINDTTNNFGEAIRATKRIYFGNNILSSKIGNYGMYRLRSLELITIPYNIKTIGDYCFDSNYHLNFVIFPKTLTNINQYAFQNNYNLKKIIFSNSLTSIATYGFYYCYSLKNIYLSNKLTTIGASGFSNCNILNNLINLKNVTTIDNYAFSNCKLISKLSFLKIQTIGTSAFNGCSNLYKIIIPNTITTINNQAFTNDPNLKTIYILKTTPPSLGGTSAFYKATGLKIYVPYSEDHSILNAYKSATNWSSYANYLFEGEP